MKKIVSFTFVILFLCLYASAYENIEDIEVFSRSVYMVNLENNQVIMDKNSSKVMEPASLTKVMTTLIVLENCKDFETETVTVPDNGLFTEILREGGANIALKAGEVISVKDLVYATMLHSACDAAELLAYHYGEGNVENFVKMMNKRAEEIGAANTKFKNPHGLDAMGHATTAYDMYLITLEALKNPLFNEIISKNTYTIPETNLSKAREVKYRVELVERQSKNYYRYAVGIKTGFTDNAGRCLITMAKKDDATYLLVLMGSNLDQTSEDILVYKDAQNLFEFAFDAYKMIPVAKKGEVIAQTDMIFDMDNKKPVNIIAKEDINLLLPKNVSREELDKSYIYKSDLILPISVNDDLGKITFSFNGKDIATFGFVSGTNVFDALKDGEMEYYPAKGFNKITFVKILLIIGIIVCIFIITRLVAKKRKAALKKHKLPPMRRKPE